MTAPFDSLDKAGFDDVFFPVEEVTYVGAQRMHLHEYPHTDGAAIEKLGRSPYRFRLVPVFDASVTAYDQLNGGPLWPYALEKLRGKFEKRQAGNLTLPTFGTVKAFCSNFSVTMLARIRSGERSEFEFTEDLTEKFLDPSIAAGGGIVSPASIAISSEALAIEIEGQSFFDEDDPESGPDLVQGIRDFAGAIFTFRDQIDLAGTGLETKLLGLASIFEEADRTMVALQNPENWRILEGVKQLWKSAVDLAADTTGKDSPFLDYVTPRRMSVQEVSIAVYGSTERVMDILQFNAIEDALSIRAGTTLR